MNLVILSLLSVAASATDAQSVENPVFQELLQKGIKMSDGTMVKLPPPIMADGLDAAEQRAAISGVASARNSVKSILQKSFYAPVATKVRTVAKPSEGEGPAIRTVDLWFVVHGDWDTLTSEDFLESLVKGSGKSRMVSKSGILTEKEMIARKLTATSRENYEERFVYTMFSLFDRVELSATRRAVLTRGAESVLAAAMVDARFADDPDYPNQWRPLLRDAQAEIKPGPAHPFSGGGGYAKITRLKEPAGAVFIECHLAYEEAFGWFDGANLVKQKAPLMVREKVRTLRRKLGVASKKSAEETKKPREAR